MKLMPCWRGPGDKRHNDQVTGQNPLWQGVPYSVYICVHADAFGVMTDITTPVNT